MGKVTKKEMALRERYFAGACDLMRSLGGTLVRAAPSEGVVPPYAQFTLMTDGGRLDVTVFNDWTATQFARPALAAPITGCNPVSGKWNHDGPGFRGSGATPQAVDAHLGLLRGEFEEINAREWNPTYVTLPAAAIDDADVESLRNREAWGELILVEDFDKAAAAEEISSQVTDASGNNPEWLRRSSYNDMMGKSDLEAYLTLRAWRERIGEDEPSAPTL